MSKQKLLSLLVILGLILSGSQPLLAVADTSVTVLEENFEDVTLPNVPDGWTATGNWGTYQAEEEFGKVAFGDYFNYPYVADANSTLTSPALNLADANSAKISFKTRCDTEYTADTDYVTLGISGDDGGTFTEVLKWNEVTIDTDGNSDGTAVKNYSNVAIPANLLSANTRLQFKWVTNADDNEHDGCFVDDIEVLKQINDDGGGTLVTSVQSVGGDTSSPYTTDDATPEVRITGAAGMMCRWDFEDKTYGAIDASHEMTITGSEAGIILPDLGADGSKSAYVSCKDASNVEQTTAQNLDISFTLDTDDDNGGTSSIAFGGGTPTGGTRTTNSIPVSLQTSASGAHAAFVDFDDSLVLRLGMDHVSGGSPTDSSSYGNTTSANDNVTFDQSGKFGKAATFTGEGEGFISVATSSSLKPEFITLSAWVKPDAFQEYATVLMKSTTGSWLDGYGLAHYQGDDNNIHFFINNYVDHEIMGTLALGEWSHVAATYDGAMMKLYINGELVDSEAFTDPIQHSDNEMRIGKGTGGIDYYRWEGGLDEILIFNRALDASEIESLHNAAAAQYSHTYGNLPNGSHSFRGYMVDGTGAVLQTSNASVMIDNGGVDTTPPAITGVTATAVGSTTATIVWNTDEDASSEVDFGTTDAYGEMAGDANSSTMSHSVVLTGLSASTTYHFRVKSSDSAGNEALSADSTFMTTAGTIGTTTGTTTVQAVLTGAPNGDTTSDSIDVTVSGTGVTHYKFKLDGRPYSAERPSSERIQFFGLALGSHVLNVIGRNSEGTWQSEANATVASWNVVTEQDNDNDDNNRSNSRRRSRGSGRVLGAFTASRSGDFNHDGRVDLFDFNLLMSQWGLSSSFADMNRDGEVDLLDFNNLMINWSK
jgi:hypothetical protein